MTVLQDLLTTSELLSGIGCALELRGVKDEELFTAHLHILHLILLTGILRACVPSDDVSAAGRAGC